MAMKKFVATDFLPRQPLFTVREALKLSRERVKAGASRCPHYDHVEGMCAHNVACNYGFSNCGAVDAISLWRSMQPKYRTPGIDAMMEAPAGALLFWSGGGSGHGHAGIADGKGKVFCTDRPVAGKWGHTDIGDIQSAWGLRPEGWSYPYFEAAGSDTRTPPEVVPPEGKNKPKIGTPNVDEIVRLQNDAIAAAKRAMVLRERPEDDAELRKIVAASRRQLKIANTLQ